MTNELERRVLQAAQEPDGAWYAFSTPSFKTANELLSRGLLKHLPRSVSPYHDGFKITRAGKHFLMYEQITG